MLGLIVRLAKIIIIAVIIVTWFTGIKVIKDIMRQRSWENIAYHRFRNLVNPRAAKMAAIIACIITFICVTLVALVFLIGIIKF